MNKKYLSLGLAAAVLVALFAMALHDPLRFPVINRVVTAVITPFAAASSAVGGWVDDTGEAMTTVKTLQQQNESLQSEINELRYANLAMAEIYAAKDDYWQDTLRQMGYYMGKFIYLMDAYDDVEKDSKDGSYNPFKELYKQDGFEEKVRQYLALIMSCCCRAFEVLPIIDNAEIMRNILYAGVWAKYTRVTQERKKPETTGEGENKAAEKAAE